MLIALHGFTETDLSWQEVFADTGIAVRTYLLPGHGHQLCPPDTSPSSVAAEIVRRFADQAPFDLLGYSMGGRVALQLALEHPQVVRRLMLVSCRPGIAESDEREQRRLADEGLAMMLEDCGIGQFVAWWESNPALRYVRPLPRSMLEHIRCRRLNQDADGLAASLRCLGQGATPSLWEHLGSINCPTMAIAGGADQRYVHDMERMVTAMPQARLSTVPECGHAVHRECRDSLVNIVRGFLAQDTTSFRPSAG
ncbi:MAG: alpha/beta fold hydrolase [Planctomycetota bacterium]|nr:MAG: alpha/beta fold hydrolase [Planctomycetota bacterium]